MLPGAAWGIVIDGELAHQGAMGVRDVKSKAPVDADTVFRIASMTKSFTAMAILKLRDSGKLSLDDPAERYVPELKTLRYPTTRLSADHDPALADALRGFPRRQPLGRSAALGTRGRAVAHAAQRHSVLERPRHRLRVLELRVCHPRPHRRRACPGSPTTSTSRSTSCGRSACPRRRCIRPTVPANRLAVGYRWEDDQWKEEPALPHGSFGSMGGMLTVDPRPEPLRRRIISTRGRRAMDLSRGRSAARRCARCSSRGVPPACASSSTNRRARAAHLGQLRLRPTVTQTCQYPRDRRA